MHRRASLVLSLPPRSLPLLVVAACSVPVATGLDDPEANRVVVALDHANLQASKEPDPSAEGKWRVDVARDDVSQALSVLRDEELPRGFTRGVLDAVGKGSLVPSEATEHAQLVAGMAGDLERSLQGVDGVLSARVHLNVPAPSPLREAAPSRGSASVLLEHRGATPPLGAESIQRLVAGGVAGLVPADVAVVLVSRPAPPSPGGRELRYVGPIAVARASMRELQAALVGLVAAVALLAGATIVLYGQLTRLRARSSSAQAAQTPGERTS